MAKDNLDQKFDLDYIDGAMYAYLDIKGMVEVLHTCGYFDTVARNKINHYINMQCDALTERGAYVTECMKEELEHAPTWG